MSGIKIYRCLTIVIFLTMVNPQSPPLLTRDLKYPNKGAMLSDVALQGIFIGDLGAWKYTPIDMHLELKSKTRTPRRLKAIL